MQEVKKEESRNKYINEVNYEKWLIYISSLIAIIGVLYFFRFNFTVIVISYTLGCLLCLYILDSNFWQKLNSTKLLYEKFKPVSITQSCETCGSNICGRHKTKNTLPWTGLLIHKQLDLAIEDFYNAILKRFVNSWYDSISLQPYFVNELRHQLRYASALLLRRFLKVNYGKFVMEKILPCMINHYTKFGSKLDSKNDIHPAASSRAAEIKYLRAVTESIMPYLLDTDEVENAVCHKLISEIFSGWVLLSLTDVLADPYILNSLIILLTEKDTTAHLPSTPNYKVEFLKTFVRRTDRLYTQRTQLLRIELDTVINDQEHFYAFMQYMKSTNQIHILQFYKDIKSFQTKILNPEMDSEEQDSIYNEARDIYSRYFLQESGNQVPLESEFVQELADILESGVENVKRLQTSRALYQAARQSQSVLEKIWLPRYLHSEEFYKLFIGSRIPVGYQKSMAQRHRVSTRFRHHGSRHIDKFVDADVSDDDSDSLSYTDYASSEDIPIEQDLSNYKVVLTDVEMRLQAPPRRGPVRVFAAAVFAVGEVRDARGTWRVTRTEHDFHLLRAKLIEYHGEALLKDLVLPSRRDNSPLETLRYKYEDFLQRLLRKSLLQTSELLYLFLTVDGDFSLVVQASSLHANSNDLANIYQAVTHHLRKEKGQHLEGFLKSFLTSTDVEKSCNLKQGITRDVEEAQEVGEDVEAENVKTVEEFRKFRDFSSPVFGNNFDVTLESIDLRYGGCQLNIKGFTQCLMYILIKVLSVPQFIIAIVGSTLRITKEMIDAAFERRLNCFLEKWLCERRLAHLIRLGHGLLFDDILLSSRDATEKCHTARDRLKRLAPNVFGIANALDSIFDLIQSPSHNKHLVYNLLDICLLELFPELTTSETSNGGVSL